MKWTDSSLRNDSNLSSPYSGWINPKGMTHETQELDELNGWLIIA